MMEMVILYKWVFVLLVSSAFCLTQLGIHLVPRQQSFNSLMLTQVSSFGVLLGMLIAEESFLAPLVIALLLTVATSFLVERFRKEMGETFNLVIFLFFMSLSYWLCSYFPSLDSHHADSYFGDVVTIQGIELIISVVGFSLGAIYLFFNRKKLMNRSFEIEVFGKQGQKKSTDLFWPVALVLMVLGIFSLGMLYTLSFMLMPPVLLAYRVHGLNRYLLHLCLVSVLSAVGGFLMALYFTRMSTVPTVVLTLFIFCSFIVLMRFVKAKMS